MTNFIEEQLILISTPIYALLILIEILLSNYQHRPFYSFKDTLTNFVMMLTNGGIDLLFRGFYFSVLLFFYGFSIVDHTHGISYWLGLFFLEDLAFYMLYVMEHYVRFFWAVHVTHHSSDYFNLTTGFRSSVFQPLYRFVFFIPIVLLGFHPADIVLMYSITQIYGILVHTNYTHKLGWLEYVFVTPSHHRVHHASNPRYLDKNMGMCLIIWDRLFGTFQEEIDDEKPVYGITKPLEDRSLTNTLFHEWKAIGADLRHTSDLGTKWRLLFKPPGWQPDNSQN